MTKRVALVCCGKQKLTCPAPAKDLYISSLFRKTRHYVENQYDSWLILSALHRVVDPNQVVQPYDVTLATRDVEAWAVKTAAELLVVIPHGSTIAFFGGARYEAVVQHLIAAGYSVERPLRGLQIGERLRWLSRHG